MDSLTKKRGILKGVITRLQNFVTVNANSISVVEAQARLENLDKTFSEYEKTQTDIDMLSEPDEIVQEDQYRQETEDKYYSTKAQYTQIIQSHSNSLSTSDSVSEPNSTTKAILQSLTQQQEAMKIIVDKLTDTQIKTSNERSVQNDDVNIKLPRINIPSFSGQYEEWPAFHDLYTTLVHNNTKLSPSEKFQFLKTCLTDEASSNLKHLTISDANYIEAWEQLKSTYNKEKYIIEAHLRNIFEATHLQPQPPATSIRKLTNIFKESVRALRALKLQTDGWDCWLNYVIIQKLDAESRQLWARESASKDSPTFENLLSFLEQREFELLYSHNTKKQNTSKFKTTQCNHTVATTTNNCTFCKSGHLIYRCPKFSNMDINKRIQFISSSRLCSNCLRSGHNVSNCKSSACCVCQQRHHTLLHTSEKVTPPPTETDTRGTGQKPTVQSFHVSQESTTILPTAVILVADSNNQYQPCRALLD